jgi:hypothetical protein
MRIHRVSLIAAGFAAAVVLPSTLLLPRSGGLHARQFLPLLLV